mmetsp:Transcript_41896/g.125239  ORF Transcript_41896/g.125239 Transcript_41896/m.125239 type:complete len:253 (-) Transcript_41896:67-825(-)
MAVVVVPEAASTADAELILAPKEGAYVDLPAEKNAADVIISFGALQGRLAFWVESAEDPGRHGPVNCLPSVPSEAYALRGMPEGRHRVHAALWEPPAADPAAQPKLPKELGVGGRFEVRHLASRCFNVKRFADFTPGYDWRPVEPWHRLPPGLEISMDLSGSGGDGQRRARIPQPWQWDATVDGAVKRVPVEAEATVATLLERLGLPAASHEMVWRQPDGQHERVLEPSWTAQQTDLFRYSKDIIVRSKLLP